MGFRIAFMGTPHFAAPTLLALIEAGHDIAAVYTQPPAPAGRGKKLRKSPIHSLAEKHDIPVFTPTSLKDENVQKHFTDMALDVAVVVAYGQILPQAILTAPKHGCINIHASLLPRWRGAAPIHRAILAGDSKTGITIMQMDQGLDTGAILTTHSTPISAEDTTGTLHDRLATLGASLINDALTGYINKGLSPQPQPETGVCYAEKIDKKEAKINWENTATVIDRQVRGLAPMPGAWFEIMGERVKVLSGTIVEETGGANTGITLSDNLLIGCGENAYQITHAQRAGKAAMDTQTLLLGWPIKAGAKVS